MKLYSVLLLVIVIFSSCQKELHELLPPAANDSSSVAKEGQLIGMKVYYLSGTDTVPQNYYEFRYDSNPKRLVEYNHMGNYITRQFETTVDTADKIWIYNNNGLLIAQSGFHQDVGNITYTDYVERGAGGELQGFSYQNNYAFFNCTTGQSAIASEKARGVFSVQLQNGGKLIHYADTTGGTDGYGNTNCDYSVYFDAAGRVEMKVLNGVMLNDPTNCNKLNYFPFKDTVSQFFYDPGNGKLLKSRVTYYGGAVAYLPADLEKTVYTASYTYDTHDNQKIAQFFQQYTWGRDLQSWFSFRLQHIGALTGGVDFDYFPNDFVHLKYGICTKISFTTEDFHGNTSHYKASYDLLYKAKYDAKGNLVSYGIDGPANGYYEFLYK